MKLPRGFCIVCGAEVALRKGDLAREHRQTVAVSATRVTTRPCKGSGVRVKDRERDLADRTRQHVAALAKEGR